MGKVIFKETGRVRELHGTFCGMVYRRTAKDETVVHLQRASTDERVETVRRAVMIAQRVMYDQGEETVERMQEISDSYHAMRQVMNDWYDEYAARIRDMDKRAEAMAINYSNKFAAPKLDLSTG